MRSVYPFMSFSQLRGWTVRRGSPSSLADVSALSLSGERFMVSTLLLPPAAVAQVEDSVL